MCGRLGALTDVSVFVTTKSRLVYQIQLNIPTFMHIYMHVCIYLYVYIYYILWNMNMNSFKCSCTRLTYTFSEQYVTKEGVLKTRFVSYKLIYVRLLIWDVPLASQHCISIILLAGFHHALSTLQSYTVLLTLWGLYKQFEAPKWLLTACFAKQMAIFIVKTWANLHILICDSRQDLSSSCLQDQPFVSFKHCQGPGLEDGLPSDAASAFL